MGDWHNIFGCDQMTHQLPAKENTQWTKSFPYLQTKSAIADISLAPTLTNSAKHNID